MEKVFIKNVETDLDKKFWIYFVKKTELSTATAVFIRVTCALAAFFFNNIYPKLFI